MGCRRTFICIALILLTSGGRALASSGDFTVQEATSAGEPIISFKRAARLLDGQLPVASTDTAADPSIDFMKHTQFGGTVSTPIDATDSDPKFAVQVTGQVEIPSAGTWSLAVTSQGHARLEIGGRVIRSIGGDAPGTHVKPIKFALPGTYTASLTYFGHEKSSELAVYDSPGKFHRIHARNADFQLVGDVANGGLSLAGSLSPDVGTGGAAPLEVSAGQTISAASSTQTGLLSDESVVLDGGSTYTWKISNAAGAPGAPDGWDNISTNSLSVISASADEPVTIALNSLNGTTPGTPAGVLPGRTYSWIIAQSASQVSINGTPQAPENLLSTKMFALDTSGFTVANTSVSLSDFQLNLVTDGNGQDLQLVYDAAPEPGTAVLVGTIFLPLLLSRRRPSSD